jgi:hypothetical protein
VNSLYVRARRVEVSIGRKHMAGCALLGAPQHMLSQAGCCTREQTNHLLHGSWVQSGAHHVALHDVLEDKSASLNMAKCEDKEDGGNGMVIMATETAVMEDSRHCLGPREKRHRVSCNAASRDLEEVVECITEEEEYSTTYVCNTKMKGRK